MSPVIRVSDDLFARLESHAQGFDSPANVIERLLNSFEGIEDNAPTAGQSSKKRDKTKYLFEGEVYGKGRLVLAIVKKFVADNKKTTFNELSEAFPKELQGSSGVFGKIEAAQAIFERTDHKRHFIKPDETIKLKGGAVAVCTEWGAGNIKRFIQAAKELGFEISKT